ncbi:MAG: SMP-30/gluconolactonase/LRE family protein [Kiritimatiellia bacterium]|nr:SMP-30/gluconolactonase/LRE family protein [Kiritimatiellia bacterium]
MKQNNGRHWMAKIMFGGCVAGLLLTAGCTTISLSGKMEPVTKSELFLTLPDTCPTPDGLTMDKDGNIIVACPNYGDMKKPAVFMKIDKQNKLSLYATCPILEKTGRACPMGVDLGPDGGLYVADNQGWPGTEEGKNEGRILKLTVKDGKVEKTEVIAHGMSHPNAVKYYKGQIWVTQSLLPKIKSEQLVSAVYRFNENERNVKLNNDESDKSLLVKFKTLNMGCQYGLDGMCFDSKGNMFVGNFGDGSLHKVALDDKGNVKSNEVFAKSKNMRTIDGICIDAKDNIYVADFSENAVCKVTPEGKVTVLARSPDCDGSKGGLDQPGEPIVRGKELIISNFDMVTGPDKVNTKHDKPYTMSVIDLNKVN